MNSQIDQIPSEITVNDAVCLWPGSLEVFNRFGVDACCGGESPIREAAARDGADPHEVVAALLRVIREQLP